MMAAVPMCPTSSQAVGTIASASGVARACQDPQKQRLLVSRAASTAAAVILLVWSDDDDDAVDDRSRVDLDVSL